MSHSRNGVGGGGQGSNYESQISDRGALLIIERQLYIFESFKIILECKEDIMCMYFLFFSSS